MKPSKRAKLRNAGFIVTTVQKFLDLSDEDMALIELKISLIEMLRKARAAKGITQQQLASLIGSSQSRVAKMEGASSDVSLDMICAALFALGISRKDIGKTLISKKAA